VETYSALRSFADSWALVVLVLFFIGVIAWVYRPGAREQQEDAARMIFRNEDRPKDDPTGKYPKVGPEDKDDKNGRS
jgi:cytochrome c oxidase cbb3-type subunit 4